MLMAENLLLMRRRYRTSVSAAALFLASYGPLGMVLDFADASVAIVSSGGSLDYQSQGQVSNGTLVGPGARLTYSAPSAKLTEQQDGVLRFQAHNLYLNSEAPANQSVTVISGASYAMTITGSVSITLSGAATGTVTAGTTTFTAASGTLTCGSTSGSGTVHLRRTPSVDTYVATAGAQVYDLPYVYSSGVRTGIMVEPAATNLVVTSTLSGLTTQTGTSITTDAGVDPFGGNTAQRLSRSATVGYRGSSASKSAVAAPYTSSYIVQKEVGDYFVITMQGSTGGQRANVTFNLSTGAVSAGPTVVGSFTTPTASITPLPNGLYRVSLSVTTDAYSAIASYIAFAVNNIASVDTADSGTTATGLVSHTQLEANSGATSPIITYGAAVTRVADNITIASNEFPSLETAGTLYAEYMQPRGHVFGALLSYRLSNNDLFEISTGSTPTSRPRAQIYTGGAVQMALELTQAAYVPGSVVKAASAAAANSGNVSGGGLIGTDDTSIAMPTGITTLAIGSRGAAAFQSGANLIRIAAFPRRLSNAELQAITA